MSERYPILDYRTSKDKVRPGDFKDALWTQYLNTLNSLNTLETASMMEKGVSLMETHVALEKFNGNVDILESLCEGYGLLDADYGEVGYNRKFNDSRKAFSKLTKLLKTRVFAERTEDMGVV